MQWFPSSSFDQDCASLHSLTQPQFSTSNKSPSRSLTNMAVKPAMEVWIEIAIGVYGENSAEEKGSLKDFLHQGVMNGLLSAI